MDARTWEALCGGLVAGHEAMMRLGMVTKPLLHAVRGGQLLGYVMVRDFSPGRDGLDAVVDLGHFASGGQADEVVMAWEAQDLAVATELPADHPDTCLSVVYARAGRHRLVHMPYQVRQLGIALETGLVGAVPQWLDESLGQEELLPPPVRGALDLAFLPWDDGQSPGLDAAGLYLERAGYTVRYAEPA